jgi:hypothetical protein
LLLRSLLLLPLLEALLLREPSRAVAAKSGKPASRGPSAAKRDTKSRGE